MISAQISWDRAGIHLVVILDRRVPDGIDMEAALCAYHGVERVTLHGDRTLVEITIASRTQRPSAEVVLLELYAQGYLRAMWSDRPHISR